MKLFVVCLLLISCASLLGGCGSDDSLGVSTPAAATVPVETVDVKNVAVVEMLLVEYRKALNIRPKSGREAEISEVRQHVAHDHLRSAYYTLNGKEKDTFFNGRVFKANTTSGPVMDGVERPDIGGLSLHKNDPQKDFENDLEISFLETDAESGFGISNDAKDDEQTTYHKVRKKYDTELDQKEAKIQSDGTGSKHFVHF